MSDYVCQLRLRETLTGATPQVAAASDTPAPELPTTHPLAHILQRDKRPWSAEASHWTGLLEMTVKQPEVKYRVFLEKFHKFVEAEGGTPRQRSLRDRVKRILDEK